MLTKED